MAGIQNVVTPVTKIAGALKRSGDILVSPKAKQAVDEFVSSVAKKNNGLARQDILRELVGKIKGVFRIRTLDNALLGRFKAIEGLSSNGEMIDKACHIGQHGERVMSSLNPKTGVADITYKNCSKNYVKDISMWLSAFQG